MKDRFITFLTAELAKEKGFDIHTPKLYMVVDLMKENTVRLLDSGRSGVTTETEYYAPTQDFLKQWLRHKHNICLESRQTSLGDTEWSVVDSWAKKLLEPVIHMYYDGYPMDDGTFKIDGYEETLQEALKLIK
jgi:hypothetical protein